MTIIDSPVHAYEANTPDPGTVSPIGPSTLRVTRWCWRWTRSASTTRSSSPPFSMYRYDASYAVEVQHAHAVNRRAQKWNGAARSDRRRAIQSPRSSITLTISGTKQTS